MTALERYIDDLVNDREPEEIGAFPKNESSWEELFDLCTQLIAEIVTLRRAAAQQSAQADGEVCPVCGGAKYVLENDGNAIKCMPCNGTGKRQ